MTERILDFKCPVCRHMRDYKTAERIDIGRCDYVVCRACFDTLEGIRNVQRAETLHKLDIHKIMSDLMDDPNDFFEYLMQDGYTKEDIISEFKRVLNCAVDKVE